VEFPIGHRKRRSEGIPVLVKKFEQAVAGRLPAAQSAVINQLCADHGKLAATPVTDFMRLWVT